jgi:DNA-binding transcriptional ArsR family regulator
LKRLNRLRRSPKLRASYLTLLKDLWAEVEPIWSRVGRPAAQAAVPAYRNQLSSGTQWYELASCTCAQVASIMDDLIERHRNGGEIVIVPCYFFGTSLLVELPNTVIVGVPAVRADHVSRARTELLAKRLKTLADPTRLAILDYLAAGPQAVGEVARAFGLAQPTVSMHVKHLREAGVVNANRTGTRVELVVDQGAVVDLLDELKAVVA